MGAINGILMGVYAVVLVVKNSHLETTIFILQWVYELHKTVVNTVKHVLSSHSKKTKQRS